MDLLDAEPTVASASPAARPRAPRLPPVFLITHEFYPHHGGIAIFSEEMARAAADLGHEVEVWAPALPPGATDKSWPFRLRRLPLKGTHSLGCVLRLMRELVVHRRRLRYASVYLPEPGPTRAMMWLQFVPGFLPRHLILNFHGSEILRFHHGPVTRRLLRRLIRHAVRIGVVSSYTRQLLCERFPDAASKTFLTPCALRAGVTAVPFASPRRPGGHVVILTVGRLHPRKGQLFIIEALQALPAADRERIEYWLVGGHAKENYEERLRTAAASSGLTVRFFGDVPDEELERLYARADIFAMTSIDHRHSIEGFGLVYLEAGAHGLPVVAHAVGGVPDAVVDGETGLLVPSRDRTALTAAFARLIADPELRRRLGVGGAAWAGRNKWSRSAELLFNEGDWKITG